MPVSGIWHILGRATALLMFAIIALTFSQVVLRYLFNSPVAWIEEISRYLFVWIVFLGAAVAFRSDSHIKIDLIADSAGPLNRLVFGVRALITLAAIVLLLWSGVLVAWRNRSIPSYTLPDVPAVLFYGAVPVAAILMIAAVLLSIRDFYRGTQGER